MKVTDGRALMRDGTPIGYTLHGDPAASRWVVLVHSLAMDRHFWDPVALRRSRMKSPPSSKAAEMNPQA